eukprot:gnl/Chilomastix_caulleri/2224.p1 GENE.gnl/Chilomastix_caulleri/2224~~gnl/Chilomastix_caulleri/2224.p1  ORF type:complete len:114 (+),score=16.73 gnl/Chilomastix_caulleri/2224:175-516(+)
MIEKRTNIHGSSRTCSQCLIATSRIYRATTRNPTECPIQRLLFLMLVGACALGGGITPGGRVNGDEQAEISGQRPSPVILWEMSPSTHSTPLDDVWGVLEIIWDVQPVLHGVV